MNTKPQNSPWLAILGIGEDGIAGLSPAARALIEGASLVAGGARHLKLADSLISGERLAWPSPMTEALPTILARRGEPVVVLASGDPFCYGIGTTLTRHVAAEEIVSVPAPSAFSLAAAHLAWSLPDTATVTLCGRPVETLAPHLQPGRQVLALSADAATPVSVAHYLCGRGFQGSTLHLMEALGGPNHRVRSATAADFAFNDIDPLNLVAIEVEAGPDAQVIPLSSGLPDEAFAHDGQLTKREIRAITLSTLAPRAGELLWDVGCGAGSVAIEWLLVHPANRAIGIERDKDRATRTALNAANLGVPRLEVAHDEAPVAFSGLDTPDAIFIGGGAQADGLVAAAWAALKLGGRMVANGVTLETEKCLIEAMQRFGGSLTRVSIARQAEIGAMHAFRPALSVTQWAAVKA